MYEEFYRLKENPFRLTPDPESVCMTPQHQEALSGLIFSAQTRPGLTVLVGEAGTGKTTLLYTVAALLGRRRMHTALVTNPMLTRDEFYDLLMLKFGIDCTSPLKSRQLTALEETLRRNLMEGRPSVLIVDEAQRLPMDLFEEIRLLLNVETPREKLLHIIMAGQQEVMEILGRPELRQLKQRVSCFCTLKQLSRPELNEYICHRLARAGMETQTIFSELVMGLIFDYSKGIPRVINTLCDSCLQIGFALQSPTVTPAMVHEIAKEFSLAAPVKTDDAQLSVASASPAAKRNGDARRAAVDAQATVPEPAGERMPMENYANRQKSLSFFAQFMDRWK